MKNKKWMAAAVLGCMLTGSATANAYESRLKPFGDVPESAWSAEHIYTLAAVQALDGYQDGGFHPLAAMSREEFIKLLVTAAKTGYDADHPVTLTDVGRERWSYPMIGAALQRGWIKAMVDSGGAFHPAAPIRREEVAYAMGSLLLDKLSEAERASWLESGWKREQSSRAFADAAGVDEALKPYVYYAVNRGMLEGSENGLEPDKQLSRQEAAAVINRLLHKEAGNKPLEVTGFYAVQSYNSLGKMPLLDRVALGWWHLNYEGAGSAKLGSAGDPFKFNRPDGWEEVTAAASSSHVSKDLMIFANKSHGVEEFLGDAAARKAFTAAIAETLSDPKYGFTGVSIDFEDLYGADKKAEFAAFLSEVKEAAKGKTLTVAVPPTYYFEGYDLPSIGKTADTVILMAYGFLYKPDRLPSAPLPLVAEAVRDTIKAGVPVEKLVLGISKKTDQFIDQGGTTTYASPASSAVEERLKKPGVQSTLSVPYLLGHIRYTDGGAHELFYEDSDSLDRKIWLARYYGLKGVSLWYMGQFTDSDWQRIDAVK
ncbi:MULTISPECIES: glycosyl hydrolase family 18 protein [unclassified Paenibacillus]|uniref:glycosyl hydrolase family 18 protein n=1 Tax=unclassified Paenibacillus TaxID=185978 RepID=UPI00020D704B|nr:MULTISPECIES: glycosyl hydrolase family 18 protein [unclassified Paenibacillus]EGL18845.1 hypothetical protein HMPREF9413_2418 [Paenibacillus sp. HGF7]EPD92697.1 hypothetical protein HMPREF1207_00468 [Paenibacillus sp. HGH0039]